MKNLKFAFSIVLCCIAFLFFDSCKKNSVSNEESRLEAPKAEGFISKNTALELAQTSPDRTAYAQFNTINASDPNLQFKYVSVSNIDQKSKVVFYCQVCSFDTRTGRQVCYPIPCPKTPPPTTTTATVAR